MKNKIFNRIFSIFLCFIIFATSVCQAALPLGALAIGGKAAAAGTAAAAGGGTIAGYVGGGVAFTAAQGQVLYAALSNLLLDLAICIGVTNATNDAVADAQATTFYLDYLNRHNLDMQDVFTEVAELHEYEWNGNTYDVWEMSDYCKEFLLNTYYGIENGSSGTVENTNDNNVIVDTIGANLIDENGNSTALLPYDNGKVYYPTITASPVLGVKASELNGSLLTPVSYVGDSDFRFTLPDYDTITGSVRSTTVVDYFNTKMFQTQFPFSYFISHNPITCIIPLPDSMQVENVETVIDTWRKNLSDSAGTDFKPMTFDDCPTFHIGTEDYSGNSMYINLTPKCENCTFDVQNYVESIGVWGSELYGAFGPSFQQISGTNNFKLYNLKFRLYAPTRWTGANYYWTSKDFTINSNKVCDTCWEYFENKFLQTNINGNIVPRSGTYSNTSEITYENFNLPDFSDSTKNYVMAVPSGTTQADIINGTVTPEWVDLNSVDATLIGNVSNSRFETVPVIPETGTITWQDTEYDSSNLGSTTNPDIGDDTGSDNETDTDVNEETVKKIEEWIKGGISFNPEIVGNPSYTAGQSFESLGDALAIGSATGIQIGTISQIISAIQQALSPSQNVDTTVIERNPNLFDLFVLLMRVLYACVCLLVRALVFLSTIIVIPASTTMLNENIVLGINFAKSLGYGSVNLFNLFTWFFTFMFGISIIKFIRSHYHI